MKIVKTGLLAALLLSSAVAARAQTATPNTWTGSVSTDWDTPANWSAGRVPLASDNVIVPGSSQALFSPAISGPGMANDLRLGPGAVLSLLNNAQLSLYGDLSNNNGTLKGVGRGLVLLVGSRVQQIGGPTRTAFRNLLVGPSGALTSAPVSVERGLLMQGDLTLGPGQDFALLSSATGPGYVVNAGGAVNGAVTVQRYIDPSINPGLGYRHLSSPVRNATFNTLVGPGFTPVFNLAYNSAPFPLAVTPFPTVLGYDQDRLVTQQAAPGFSSAFTKGFYSPDAPDPMVPGMGYTINMPGAANGVSGVGRVVSFTGDLSNGPLSVALARGPVAGQGWSLLGNPYPSPLDWDRVITDPGTQGINTALYVFKSTGQYVGTYASYVNGVAANGGTNVLPLGQAFFVFCVNPTGSVAYSNAERLSSDSTLVQRPGLSLPALTTGSRPLAGPLTGLRLLFSGPGAACEAVVSFTAGATPDFDLRYDALSIPVGALRVSTQTLAGEELAINALPLLSNQPVAVKLTLTTPQAGTYRLARTEGLLPAGFAAYLIDSQNNTVTNLSNGPVVRVPLSLGAGTSDPGRFTLLFSPTAPLSAAASFASAGATLYPNPATGSVNVLVGPGHGGAARVELLNVLGQCVLRTQLNATAGAAQPLSLAGIPAGVYSLRLSTGTGQLVQRLIIK